MTPLSVLFVNFYRLFWVILMQRNTFQEVKVYKLVKKTLLQRTIRIYAAYNYEEYRFHFCHFIILSKIICKHWFMEGRHVNSLIRKNNDRKANMSIKITSKMKI